MTVNFVENNFDETNKEEFSQNRSTENILSLNHFPDTCTLDSGSVKSWYYDERVGFLCTCEDDKLYHCGHKFVTDILNKLDTAKTGDSKYIYTDQSEYDKMVEICHPTILTRCSSCLQCKSKSNYAEFLGCFQNKTGTVSGNLDENELSLVFFTTEEKQVISEITGFSVEDFQKLQFEDYTKFFEWMGTQTRSQQETLEKEFNEIKQDMDEIVEGNFNLVKENKRLEAILKEKSDRVTTLEANLTQMQEAPQPIETEVDSIISQPFDDVDIATTPTTEINQEIKYSEDENAPRTRRQASTPTKEIIQMTGNVVTRVGEMPQILIDFLKASFPGKTFNVQFFNEKKDLIPIVNGNGIEVVYRDIYNQFMSRGTSTYKAGSRGNRTLIPEELPSGSMQIYDSRVVYPNTKEKRKYPLVVAKEIKEMVNNVIDSIDYQPGLFPEDERSLLWSGGYKEHLAGIFQMNDTQLLSEASQNVLITRLILSLHRELRVNDLELFDIMTFLQRYAYCSGSVVLTGLVLFLIGKIREIYVYCYEKHQQKANDNIEREQELLNNNFKNLTLKLDTLLEKQNLNEGSSSLRAIETR